MVCANCNGSTRVVNSRLRKRSNQIWRRRQCQNCQTVFTTTETLAYDTAWVVRAKSGALTPFMSDKLVMSLHSSLKHRKTALSDAVALSNTIIGKLQPKLVDGLIDSQDIRRVTEVALNRFDSAASVNYRAHHRS